MSNERFESDGVTLICGDSLDVMPSIPNECATLLWTDPPYGHSNQAGDLQSARIGVSGGRKRAAEPIQNDDAESMRRVVDGVLLESVRVLRRECCCCCCCGGGGPSPTFAWLAQRMDTSGLSFFHSVIWDKTARGPGMGWRFRRDYEMVMVSHRKSGKLAWSDSAKASSNILRFRPPISREHPNEKPVALVDHFISLTTDTGDLVIDPFMGSGTTGIACIRTGRKFIGIEKDPKHFAIAVERIKLELEQGDFLRVQYPVSNPKIANDPFL